MADVQRSPARVTAYGEEQALTAERPRFVPEREFPPYTYIPGRTPHPAHDRTDAPGGMAEPPENLTTDPRQQIREFLYGIDLFNHGYYWEAHEVWEGLWHAAGRSGPMADFFKGLIKLAAAGVKTLEGAAVGRRRHAVRAAELFLRAADGLSDARSRQSQDVQGRCLGLSLRELAMLAHQVAICSTEIPTPPARPTAVLGFALAPEIDAERW